ncbi:MAG: response regulator [Holophaga sp.]|nr:response regulator [Holophaga sp.]
MKPIRKLLLRELLMLMGLLVLVSVSFAWFGTRRILDEQIEARSSESLARLAGDLRKDFDNVERVAQAAARWWAEGKLDTTEGAAAGAQLRPLMLEFPEIANLVVVTTDGWGLSCLREATGLGIYQLDARQANAQKRYFFRKGETQSAPSWEPTPYRVFQRPWYTVAQSATGPQWVSAYRFATLATHGISYVIPLRDAHGKFQGAICADIFLDSLSARTWAAQPTPHSQVLVTDETGRALILPRDTASSPDTYHASPFLRTLGPDFLPLFHTLLPRWQASGRPLGAMHLRHHGTHYTCTIKPLEAKGVQWFLSLAVPDQDYLGASRWAVVLLLSSGLCICLVGIWRARGLADRFSAPLETLAQAAHALGQGSAPVLVPSNISEVATLAEALHRAGMAIEKDSELQLKLQHSQRLETVGTLAGGIAHDVNNQLAAIVGQLNLGREFLPADHPSAKRIEKAEDAAQRCAQMIKALLGFAHQTCPALQAIDLNALVRRTGTLLERLLGGRIRLDIDLAPDLGLVHGDLVSLEQVLMNLAVNARDAMPMGGRLWISTRPTPNNQIQLSVKDTGSGIPAEILPRIFDPFFTTKEVGKGTGLGLAMVFGIIQTHAGHIEVKSEAGQGAEFIITLDRVEPPPPVEVNSPTQEMEEHFFAGRRILVVEDEPPLRELLAEGFISRRAQVDTARDGEEGWMLWKGSRYDLIISDQRMPELTGLELVTRIRATGSSIPILLTSGYGLEGMESELARDPHLRTLLKPFSFRRLFQLAKELLES